MLDAIQLMIHRSYPSRVTSPSAGSYNNPSHIGLGLSSARPLSAPDNRVVWRRGPRMSVYWNLEASLSDSASVTANDDIKQFLQDATSSTASLQAPASIDFLAHQIGITLFGFLLRSDEPLDLDSPLAALGIDSLVSIELRNWFRQRLGLDFTVVKIVGASSIRQLGEMSAVMLADKYQARI